MMRALLPATFACLPLLLSAQQSLTTAYPLHQEGKHQGVNTSVIVQQQGDRGSAFYLETFDDGLNGWTINTPIGTVDWELTSEGPGPTTSTYPVPVLNTSTPNGWMMVDDDFYGVPGNATETWLVSPVIDLTGTPTNLKIEFDQYFQEWEADHCYVGVSTDGGITWNEVEINEGVGREGRPNPELVDLDISLWVAPDPANVQIRFRYESIWDYGWQIDNVAIRELPDNDMALMSARRTIFDFEEYGREFLPYSIYPVNQLQAMQLNGVIRNKGAATQTGVQFTAVVDGPGGEVFNASSTASDLQPTGEVAPFLAPFTPPEVVGEYTVAYSVTQDQADDIPENNSLEQQFSVSDNVYAMDLGTCQNVLVQGPDNVGETFEVGSFFEFVNADDITAVQVAVHESTEPGALLYAMIYSDFDPLNTVIVAESDEYEVQADDLNAIGGSNFVTIPLNEPLPVFPGDLLLVVAGYFSSSEAIGFCTGGITPPQISIIRYPNDPEPNFTTTRIPMVRAIMAETVGIAEETALATDIQAWPNPFNDGLDMRFELLQRERVTLELRDVTGRLVNSMPLGVLPQGTNQVRIDGTDMADGLYTYTLFVGDTRVSGTLVKASH